MMSRISNPPLDPPPGRLRSASGRHASGPIVNPPLEGSRAGPAADRQNPPLDGATTIPASDADVLDNPRLDTTSVEAWFEAQLGSDTVPTTKPTPAATKVAPSRKPSSSKGSGTTTRSATKKSTKKPAPRAKAAKSGAAKRPPRKKQAARKRR